MTRRISGARSLGTKLALVVFGVLGLTTVVVLGVQSWTDRRWAAELQHELNGDVARHIASSDRFFEDGELRLDAAKHVFMKAMVVNPSLEIYLLDGEGRILAFDAPREVVVRERVDLDPVRTALATPTGVGGPVWGDDPRCAIGRKPIGVARVDESQGDGYVYVVLGGGLYGAITADLFQKSSARQGVAWILSSALVAGLVGFVALRVLVRPLERLRAAMVRVQNGDRVHLEAGNDEVGDLTRAFARLTKALRAKMHALAEQDDRRRALVANISHDLRTPTAAVLGYLEGFEDELESLPRDAARERVAGAARQARRLSRLVDQLFELARLEVAERPPSPEDFSVAELVQDVVRKYERAPHASRVDVGASFPLDLPDVSADIGLVERALDNLIDNAVRHSAPGGCVRVRLAEERDVIRVSVEDDGAGIDPAHLERLREGRSLADGDGGVAPSRADEGRRSDDPRGGGMGLGLAITRRIARLHGDDLVLESESGRGTTASFTLRTAPDRLVPRVRRSAAARSRGKDGRVTAS